MPLRTTDNKIRIFGNRTRIALLDAMMEAGTGFDGRGLNGLSNNVFDDLLAKGTAVRNKQSAHSSVVLSRCTCKSGGR